MMLNRNPTDVAASRQSAAFFVDIRGALTRTLTRRRDTHAGRPTKFQSGVVAALCQLSPKRLCIALLLILSVRSVGIGAESWAEALARMPLASEIKQLNRTNAVDIMLRAFQSNDVVKALIFMPGATDEFYMFRRAKAELSGTKSTLFDAVSALTNQTLIRATFRPPLLLLHTGEDFLEPEIVVENEHSKARLKAARVQSHVFCDDRDWGYLQPILRWSLGVEIKPWRNSRDSWHFYRHSFAAWNLSGWEALETAALAGKSKFTVKRGGVVFEVDRRVGTPTSNKERGRLRLRENQTGEVATWDLQRAAWVYLVTSERIGLNRALSIRHFSFFIESITNTKRTMRNDLTIPDCCSVSAHRAKRVLHIFRI